jgi:hypothetical protein
MSGSGNTFSGTGLSVREEKREYAPLSVYFDDLEINPSKNDPLSALNFQFSRFPNNVYSHSHVVLILVLDREEI